MSDLAQQLRKRKDQTIGTTQRSIHVKPSLLFDGREAARIETTAIHLLALGGLEQLKKLEPRLKSFEATLFASPSNTELNRESQTKEANRRLDEAIESFLSLVSPFFLLKASHKCLEYLIRRYSIHEHNTDALLKCMLPYHASNVFVRVVQLMPLRHGPWQCLEACKKNGVPLDRKVLVEHAAKNRSMLTFVAETVKEFIANKAQCKSLIAFFVALVLETIARSGDIDSELVSALLPYLLHGFKSKNSDYQLSSMMITCALCSTPQKSRGLDRSLLSSLLTAVTCHAQPHHHHHALLAALVVLSDERFVNDDTCQLPDATFDTLTQWRDFTTLLKEVVAQGYAIDNLIRPFFRSLTRAVIARPELMETLTCLIKEVPVGEQIAALVGELLALFEANYSALKNNAAFCQQLKEVLHVIDRKYPSELDQGIETKLRGVTSRTQPTWMTLFIDTRHHPLALTERNNSDYTTVASGLKALTRPRARVLALDHLLALSRDELAPLISGTLMQHLGDSDLELVLHALQVPDLVKRVEAPALFGMLSSLLRQSRVQQNSHVLSQALHVMTQPFIELHPMYAEQALPYLVNHVLFLTNTLEVNRQALKIALSYPHELFYAFKADRVLTSDVSKVSNTDLNVRVIEALARAIATRPGLQQVVTRLVASSHVPLHVPGTAQLALIRALHVTSDDTRLSLANLALEICARDWQSEHVTTIAPSIDQHEGLPNWDAVAFEEFIARRPARVSEFQFYALRHVLKSVTKNGITESYSFVNGGLHGLLAKLFIVMTSSGPDMSSFDQHLKLLFTFLGHQLTNFLAYFWTEPEISPLISVRSLRVLNTWLKSATTGHVTVALPALLAALAHNSPHVRAAALACVTNLTSSAVITRLSPLLSRVTAQAAEFVASPKHLSTWTRAVWGVNNTPVRLGDNERAEQFLALTDVTLASPLTWVRVKLLSAFSAVDDTGLRVKLISRTSPHLTALLTRLQVTGATVTLAEARLIETLLRYYSVALPHHTVDEVQPWLTAMTLLFEKYFRSLTHDSTDDVTIFGAEDPTIDQSAFPYLFNPARLALECIHEPVYRTASRDIQAALFTTVLSLMLSKHAKIRALAQSVMRRKIPAVDHALISHELSTCHREILAVIERHSPNKRKRQKSSATDTPSAALTPEMEQDLDGHLTRVTALLETFQYRPQFLSRDHVPLLFALVDLIIDQQHAVGKHPAIEYITQQLLGSLTLVTQALVDHVLTQQQLTALGAEYHVDSIVQVIRVSQDPSVQKNALLFLAAAARVFPARVLEHIMPIFTYMGASSVRFDDNYTFLVIQKTIEAVVPALVQSRDTLAPLTLFAAFVQHIGEIPAHRRLLLFSMLLKILSAEYLSVLLSLLFFKHVQLAQTTAKSGTDSIVDFCKDLCLKFEPREVLQSFNLFLAKCNDAATYFQKKRRGETVADLERDLATHGIDKHVTEHSVVHVTGDFVRFVASYVSSKEFVQQMIDLEGEAEERTQSLSLTLLETALVHVKQLSAQQAANDSSLREELKCQVDDSYELIDRCNELLSIPSFVHVIDRLLLHDDKQLQRRALLLLNDKVTQLQRSLHHKHAVPFIKMTRQLTDVIVADILQNNGKDFTLTGATAVNKQTAALSLEIIIRSFGERKEFAGDFKELLAPLTAALKAINSSAQSSPADLSQKVKVSSSLLLCLASLVGALGPALIEHVNEFYPVLLDVMDLALKSREADQALVESLRLLQLSTLSALKVIVTAIGKFLGKYLARTLISVVHPALVEHRNAQLQSHLNELLRVTAAQIDLRQLLSPIAVTYQHALAQYQNLQSVHHVITLLARVTSALDKKHVPVHHKPLFKLYLQLFDLRHDWCSLKHVSIYSEHVPDHVEVKKRSKNKTTVQSLNTSAEQLTKIEQIEAEMLSGFLNMVMKLNENTFKPLYLVTMEWTHVNHVISASTSGDDAMTDGNMPPAQLFSRTYMFYKLNLALQQQLKSIFSPYLNHVIDHVAAIIARPQLITGAVNTWMAIEIPLLQWLALALQQTSAGTFDKRRFDKLSVPLVALIDRATAPPSPPLSAELYRARVSRVIKVLSALCQAVHHESLWKSLNHALLLLARHVDSHVREAAVRALIEQYTVLGEEYLPLLPESIQSISELMEDSNSEVEASTLQLIKIIEDLLGQEFAELLK